MEREKASLQLECRDAQTALDRVCSEKSNLEKDQKLTLAALGDVQVNKLGFSINPVIVSNVASTVFVGVKNYPNVLYKV